MHVACLLHFLQYGEIRNMKAMIVFLMAVGLAGASEFRGDYDGHWYVTRMTCNGERPSEQTRALYQSPNYIPAPNESGLRVFPVLRLPRIRVSEFRPETGK